MNVVNGQGKGVARGRRESENCKLRSAAEKWQLQKSQCRRQNLADNASAAPTDGTVSSLPLSLSLSQLVAAIVPPGKNMLPTHRCHGKCKRRQQRRARAKAKAEPKANVRISPSSEFAVYNFITFKLNAFSCRFSCPGGLNGPPPSCPCAPFALLTALSGRQTVRTSESN